jgi:hypothetical protein
MQFRKQRKIKMTTNKKIEFSNMSLHTLANLYIDCFSDWKNRLVYANEQKTFQSILVYVAERSDESLFGSLVDLYAKVRNVK